MSGFNGSGTYVRGYNWVSDAANSINITASRVDADMADVVAGFNLTVTRDGQGAMTAPFKCIAGTVGTPALNFSDATTGFYRPSANVIAAAVSGANVFTLDSTGITATPIGGSTPAAGAFTTLTTNGLVLSPYAMKNRLINASNPYQIDQRNNGSLQTITSSATYTSRVYTIDRWSAWSTGANVTGQRVAGSAPLLHKYQFTGAASVTGIYFGQPIEAVNIADLAGSTVAFTAELANSLLTTVTWTAYYAGATDNWATRTQIATGTFTVNSSLAQYTASIALPAAASAGVMIELSVGAQTSGTWTIGREQLEIGAYATPFEQRQIGTELALCQRYYVQLSSTWLGVTLNSTDGYAAQYKLPVTMRAAPTLGPGASYTVSSGSAGTPVLRTSGLPTDTVMFYNPSSSWTINVLLQVTGALGAEL